MGANNEIAINEGVFLLQSLSPDRLNQLRIEFPSQSRALAIGIIAGSEDGPENDKVAMAMLRDRAQIMIVALSEAEAAAKKAVVAVSRRVKSARRQRLLSQILVLIGSSSSLATLALSKNRAAVISAVLTLLAALWNLLAEYQEKLLNPQAGNIYDAFQRLAEGAYKTRTMSTELTLALKYNQNATQIGPLVASANALCEELNGWLIQMVASMPQTSGAA